MKFLSLIIFASLFCSCSKNQKEENWTSYIYPDKNHKKRSLKLEKEYKSIEECKDSSKKYLMENQLKSNGFFKCGLNCKYNENMKIEICERMVTF